VIPPFSTACSAMTISSTTHRFQTAPLRSRRSWETFRLTSSMSQVSLWRRATTSPFTAAISDGDLNRWSLSISSASPMARSPSIGMSCRKRCWRRKALTARARSPLHKEHHMSETKARQIVLVARAQGKPRLTDFRLEETAIPARGPGQILLRVQYLSLDPYMRGRMDDRESYAQPTPLGGVMPGESVATVVASQNPAYSAGDTVAAPTRRRSHAHPDHPPLRQRAPASAAVPPP